MKDPEPTSTLECDPSGWSAVLLFGMVKMPAYWRPDGDNIRIRHSMPKEIDLLQSDSIALIIIHIFLVLSFLASLIPIVRAAWRKRRGAAETLPGHYQMGRGNTSSTGSRWKAFRIIVR